MDGLYLSTSPEHYCLHNCYIKSTNAKRLTDTIQFKHKHITNPTISPHDKIMNPSANCKEALEGLVKGRVNQQLTELHMIVNNAQAHLQQKQDPNTQQAPRVETQQVPGMETNTQQTNTQPSSEQAHHHLPTLAATTRTRQRSQCNNLSHLMAPVNLPAAPPALSTQSKVCVANTLTQPHQQQHVSRLWQPTNVSLGKTHQANAVVNKPNWRRLL